MKSFFFPAAVSFTLATVFASFFEWALHRFVMHKRVTFFSYPFEKHAMVHHQDVQPAQRLGRGRHQRLSVLRGREVLLQRDAVWPAAALLHQSLRLLGRALVAERDPRARAAWIGAQTERRSTSAEIRGSASPSNPSRA